MSKLLAKKIQVTNDFKMNIENGTVSVQGKYGSHSIRNYQDVIIVNENNLVTFDKTNVKDIVKAATFVSNFENAIIGTQTGFQKTLNLVGVGYKVAKHEKGLVFNVGFSHPVIIDFLDNIEVIVESPIKLVLRSVDCVRLGDVCAKIISKTRPVEPYKGKGVILEGTYIIRKQGKKK